MRHAEAIDLLPDLGSDRLDPGIEAALERHAGHCAACRDWRRTHDLLTAGLTLPDPDRSAHPESALLALWLVQPERIDEPDRQELRRHLGSCAVCRDLHHRLNEAVRDARPRGVGGPLSSPGRVVSSAVWKRTVAAAFTVLVVAGGLYVGTRFIHRSGRSLVSEGEPVAVVDEHLSGHDLDGVWVIRSDGALTLADLTVRSGADVTLGAREVVAFGDGFRVAAGARLRVGSEGSEPPSSRDR